MNNAHTAAENASNAPAFPSISVTYRPITAEENRRRLLAQAEALCAAEINGQPWDVKLFADRLVESAMAMRANAEKVA